MDELLYERVKQLRELDDRLERIETLREDKVPEAIESLRFDLKMMILAAKQAHAEF